MSKEKLNEEMDCVLFCPFNKNCVEETNKETQFCISAIIFYASIDPKVELKIESNNGVVEALAIVGGQKKAEVSRGVITYERLIQ